VTRLRRSVTTIGAAGILAIAAAYGQPAQCTADAGVTANIRGEGLTELLGDVLLNCTGGTPATAGSAVPQWDITVFLNTNITSRVLALAADTWTEALLTIDEPHTTANPAIPLLACGDANAPDVVGSPGVCPVTGTGNGVGVYNGASNRPNVWQGRLNGNTSITWLNVPVDAPANGSTRVIRITNIRVAASQLALSTTLVPTAVNMSISWGDSSVGGSLSKAVPRINTIQPFPVAYLQKGIGSATVSQSATLQQNQSNNPSIANGSNYTAAIADSVIVFKEGYDAALKRKNWGYSASGSFEQNQNVPDVNAVNYETESGFENIGPSADPSPNPPVTLVTNPVAVAATAAFSTYHGLVSAGEADAGTHLMLNFANVPDGVLLFVPTAVPLIAQQSVPNALPPGTVTGMAYLVLTDANGAGSTRVNSISGGAITGCSATVTNSIGACPTSTGLALIATGSGSGLATYEVFASDAFHLEQVSIPVVVAYTANTVSNLPAPGLSTTVYPSLGPLSEVATASSNDPLPRFVANTTSAEPLFTVVEVSPRYAGYVDTATCQTISGWAVDLKRLNQSISVRVYDGTTLLATVTANQSRSDVGTALGDNGLHGFAYTPPSGFGGGAHTIHVEYETSTIDLSGSPKALSCGAANYAGYIDTAACSGINGWVADRNRLNTSITVSLWDGGTQIASTTASGSRSDVGAFLGDNGLHGFSLQLPSSYANGVAHTLQVHFESSGTQLPGSPITLTCGSSGAVSYVGWVDTASCSGINGWAADRNRLNQSITVSLWDPATQAQIASTTANGSRPDVGTAIGDNGLHGYSLQLPSAYSNGASHALQVRFETSATQLSGSPVTLTCGSASTNYAGYVDVLNCSTIAGWGADRNSLNNSINISVYDGSTLLTTVSASGSRSDVGTYLGDNGLHGFSLATPASLLDGRAHLVTVRPGNSSNALAGPQSLTCQ
jgi:hypothetical protein